MSSTLTTRLGSAVIATIARLGPRGLQFVFLSLASVFIATQGTVSAQVITEFPVPTLDSLPWAIAAGPDGALWFTELQHGGKIGRITTAGVITEFSNGIGNFYGITTGPDGELWFTEEGQIGRITTSGEITTFPVSGLPEVITVGPDGALWFTEYYGGKIGRITTDGVVTEFPIPTSNALPVGITAGPDGALWFTENHACKIGRVTTSGVFTEF